MFLVEKSLALNMTPEDQLQMRICRESEEKYLNDSDSSLWAEEIFLVADDEKLLKELTDKSERMI